jgi:hypothetical protein
MVESGKPKGMKLRKTNEVLFQWVEQRTKERKKVGVEVRVWEDMYVDEGNTGSESDVFEQLKSSVVWIIREIKSDRSKWVGTGQHFVECWWDSPDGTSPKRFHAQNATPLRRADMAHLDPAKGLHTKLVVFLRARFIEIIAARQWDIVMKARRLQSSDKFRDFRKKKKKKKKGWQPEVIGKFIAETPD